MPLRKAGFDRYQRALAAVPDAIRRHGREANADSAAELTRVAKALVAKRTGTAMALIRFYPSGDGQLVDFGPLSKILEGGTKQRFTKSGANRGAAPAQPFVNPAMRATRDFRRKRALAAVRAAYKEAGIT